ncbi:MAG: hypothetical protein R3304_06425 [Longimicrobiales bacterium]|nr:hypothetical protein [Longimicrobiales bacterium]
MVRLRPFPLVFLSATVLGAQGGLTAQPLGAQESLTLDTPVAGELSRADTTETPGQISKVIPLEVAPGTRVEISLESGSFDAYVALAEIVEDGFRIVSQNDDHPGLATSTDALTRYIPEEGLEYAVWVGSYDGSGTGPFTLRAVAAAPGDPFVIPLEVGAWVEGELDADDALDPTGAPVEAFDFEAYALERVMVLAEGAVMPSLRVVDAGSGDVLSEAEPEESRTLLDWFPPADGVYRLEVVSSEGRDGRFAVRLWKPSLTDAELHGLRVDSLVHHPVYGFRFPSPSENLFFFRGVENPHRLYVDGVSHSWYLTDDAGVRVAVLLTRLFEALTDSDFDEISTNFLSNLAPGAASRVKKDGDRSARMVLPRLEGGIESRCIGSHPDDPAPGRILCVTVIGASGASAASAIVDGMSLR